MAGQRTAPKRATKPKVRNGKRALTQDDVFRAKYVIGGALSPNGDAVVYVLSETVVERGDEKQKTSLWSIDLPDGAPRRLTNSSGNDSAPVFTPNGDTVYFLSSRNKVPQVFRIALHGGEARAATAIEQGVTMFALSPDGQWLAFSALQMPRPDTKGHIRLTRPWFRFDPVPGYLQHRAQALYVMPATGGTAKAVTPHDGIITALTWSPNSKSIAYTVTGGETHDEFMDTDLHVVSRAGKRRTLLKNSQIALPFWTTDGRAIGFVAQPDGDPSRQLQLFLIDANGKTKPQSRTANLDLGVGGLLQVNSPAAAQRAVIRASEDGHTLAQVGCGGESRLYRIALRGAESHAAVIGGARVCCLLDARTDLLLFSAQDCNTPPELCVARADGSAEQQLTHHNDAWRLDIQWPEVERVIVRSAPNVDIEGWVLKPAHARAPYKTVLNIHGGPHSGFGYSFNADFQELVGAGYAVAFANPRGSAGYGDAFSSAIIKRWGEPEAEDFNAFLDHLVKRRIAHKDRLAVTGVSGGGHLTGWLIGHTQRFKAAVPEQGVYNMFSMYGVSDAGRHLISTEMGGEPHEIPDRYWSLSPLAHAHKCTTPTLLIQGENDVRCPMEQAEQMYTMLHAHGCTVELLRLANCNHGLQIGGPPALRRYRMTAMLDWFNKYVR